MSNTLDLQVIDRKCGALAGIQKVSLTSMDNINQFTPIPAVIDTALLFSIYFRDGTGGYTERSKSSAPGRYIEQSLIFFTPKKRFDVDYIIEQLLNNNCAVIYQSYDGDESAMLNAKMSYVYTSGTKRTDRNGTSFTFAATTRHKVRINVPSVIPTTPPIEIDGPIEVPTFDGPLRRNVGVNGGSVDVSAPNDFPSYFVEILPQPVSYLPSQAGNALYLNKFITASDGLNYFIDYKGNAMQFASFPKFHQQFKYGEFDDNSVTITFADLPDDPLFIWVFQNGRKKEYTQGDVNVEQYSRDGQTLTFYRLTEKSEVNIYWGGGHSYNTFSITQSHYQHFESDEFVDNTVTITVGTLFCYRDIRHIA